MKRTDLAEYNLTKEQIDAIMTINGADIENAKKDVKALQADIEERDNTINDLNERIKGMSSDADEVTELKDKVAKYEKAEQDRKALEQQAAADRLLNEQIAELCGEREFVSDFAKTGFIAAIKQARENDKVSGLKDIFENLSKDKDGIFKNKQQEKIDIPPLGGKDGDGGGEKPTFKNFF